MTIGQHVDMACALLRDVENGRKLKSAEAVSLQRLLRWMQAELKGSPRRPIHDLAMSSPLMSDSAVLVRMLSVLDQRIEQEGASKHGIPNHHSTTRW